MLSFFKLCCSKCCRNKPTVAEEYEYLYQKDADFSVGVLSDADYEYVERQHSGKIRNATDNVFGNPSVLLREAYHTQGVLGVTEDYEYSGSLRDRPQAVVNFLSNPEAIFLGNENINATSHIRYLGLLSCLEKEPHSATQSRTIYVVLLFTSSAIAERFTKDANMHIKDFKLQQSPIKTYATLCSPAASSSLLASECLKNGAWCGYDLAKTSSEEHHRFMQYLQEEHHFEEKNLNDLSILYIKKSFRPGFS